MLQQVSDFLYKVFGSYELATMFSGMIPLLEIKGAICFGIRNGLAWWQSLLFAYIGSTFVFLPIYFLLRPLLNALKKVKWFEKFAVKCENYIVKKAEKAADGNDAGRIKFWSVFIFVAIPLPMTGVYMGTAVAAFLDMPFFKAFIAILLGNIVAGLIITLLAVLCIGIIDYILYGLFAMAVILLAVTVIKVKNASSDDIKDK